MHPRFRRKKKCSEVVVKLYHSSWSSIGRLEMVIVDSDIPLIKGKLTMAKLAGRKAFARSLPLVGSLGSLLLAELLHVELLDLQPFLRNSSAADSAWLWPRSLPSTMMRAISRYLAGTAS